MSDMFKCDIGLNDKACWKFEYTYLVLGICTDV